MKKVIAIMEKSFVLSLIMTIPACIYMAVEQATAHEKTWVRIAVAAPAAVFGAVLGVITMAGSIGTAGWVR
jgi:hypothetical protein